MLRRLHFSVIALFLFACTPESADPKPDDGFQVVMVMDMAGLGDKGFNDPGLKRPGQAPHPERGL